MKSVLPSMQRCVPILDDARVVMTPCFRHRLHRCCIDLSWYPIVQCLMRTLGVVVTDPNDQGLGMGERVEDVLPDALLFKRADKAFDTPFSSDV